MLWWILATVIAFFVKGLCGFANTLVFTTILSFGNSNVNISPVELILGYPTNAILAWKERKAIKWGICIPLALLVIAGSIPGALFLKNVDTGIVKIVFGVVIVLIGLEMMIRELRPQKSKQSKVLLAIIGILSGVLCGLYGVGALLGAYINRVTDDSSSFKANICVVFLVENTFRVVLYALWGIIAIDILKQALVLMPFMLVGLALGMLSGKVLNEKIVKKIVIIMLVISGAALVVNSL
ncbi:MAG: sulfite exporter TauE/SafE family protein [Lachnospiraceae bacterium]|nr:sulfite exporter TauE/SafE family protein [Lachnospiraceae bacterium]